MVVLSCLVLVAGLCLEGMGMGIICNLAIYHLFCSAGLPVCAQCSDKCDVLVCANVEKLQMFGIFFIHCVH